MMPQNLSAFRGRKLRFNASKPVRFSRIRHCLIASLPQNRVRFSRLAKENQRLAIVAKAKKTLSAYRLSRRRREGAGKRHRPSTKSLCHSGASRRAETLGESARARKEMGPVFRNTHSDRRRPAALTAGARSDLDHGK
jgi:hypothetical protein